MLCIHTRVLAQTLINGIRDLYYRREITDGTDKYDLRVSGPILMRAFDVAAPRMTNHHARRDFAR